MFSVLFELQPRRDEWDVYRARATARRAELEQAPGFVGNVDYSSLTRDGWILSLSDWRDEASILGWHDRTRGNDGSNEKMVADHRLRVGEVTWDTARPQGGGAARELEDSDAPNGTYVTLIEARQTLQWVSANNPEEIAIYLGFDLYSYGDCISWDIFDSISNPGDVILVVTWKDARSATDHAATQIVPGDARVRVLRVVRDHSISFRPGASPGQAAAGDATIRG